LRRNNGLGRLNIPELALAAIPLLNEVAMSERSDSDACRYCREPLRVGASYCSNCKRFQTLWTRVTGEVNLTALIALIPIVTLSVAFLNKTVITPFSRVQATVVRCTHDEVIAALSNTGTRDAVLEGGFATFEPKQPDFDRWLNPPGDSYNPVVVKAGQALVAHFVFADVGRTEPLPVPELQPPSKCAYGIALSAVEFGGARRSVPAGGCTC